MQDSHQTGSTKRDPEDVAVGEDNTVSDSNQTANSYAGNGAASCCSAQERRFPWQTGRSPDKNEKSMPRPEEPGAAGSASADLTGIPRDYSYKRCHMAKMAGALLFMHFVRKVNGEYTRKSLFVGRGLRRFHFAKRCLQNRDDAAPCCIGTSRADRQPCFNGHMLADRQPGPGAKCTLTSNQNAAGRNRMNARPPSGSHAPTIFPRRSSIANQSLIPIEPAITASGEPRLCESKNGASTAALSCAKDGVVAGNIVRARRAEHALHPRNQENGSHTGSNL